MRKLKLYLETSVWNYYYADDTPEKRDITREFFSVIESFEIFVADPVRVEFSAAPPVICDRLLAMVAKYKPVNLDATEEIDDLAAKYLESALPSAAELDALHIAYATYYELDFVISWNMKHIANIGRQEKVRAVNRMSGYTKELSLISPFEVSRYAI